jgi:hypothetical protein
MNVTVFCPHHGGDFIVDKNGVLRLVHPSHDPTDRPSADELLTMLKSI